MARLLVVQHVDALCILGWTKTAAIARVSRESVGQTRVSPATIWNWLRLISGVSASDRLPALAPRWRNKRS